MQWDQDVAPANDNAPEDVVDAVFGVSGRTLPVDHAYALSQAVQRALPWFGDEPLAGLHLIHGADSGNGWWRPGEPQALLHLSRRTKLTLRIPAARVADAGALLGRTLDVDGSALSVVKLAIRPLSRITTLFARCVAVSPGDDEGEFLRAAAAELDALGIGRRKMLCGLTTSITTPAGALRACSRMLADLVAGDSVLLQRRGLGPHRRLGCGLFIPHKDIGDVRRRTE
jgi:CRISPR-associated protein Cas6